MTTIRILKWIFIHCFLTLGHSFSLVNESSAQNITLDGTLGPTQSLTGPNYIIRQQDGLTVGSNLFHSFGRFSLNAGEVARFQSDAGIRNILSRVTGGTASQIDGLIFTTSSNVNLFLMNPSGIIFGPNARLDVGGSARGSFVATTLDVIVFPNGAQFSAKNIRHDRTLLSVVGDPSGFLATQRPAAIASTRSRLEVYSGQSLVLLGGDITIDGSTLLFQFPVGGRIELGSVAEPGQVNLNVEGNALQLTIPDRLARADVAILNGSRLDALADTGGDITIQSRNLTISGRSNLVAGIDSFRGTPTNQAGTILLNATDMIRLDDGVRVENNVNLNALGNSGNITIQARDLLVTGGAQLSTSTFGQGNSGSLRIEAERVVFDGQSNAGFVSGAFSDVADAAAVGNAGNIQVNARSLSILNGASLTSSTNGQGNAGAISINADNILVAGLANNGSASSILSEVSATGVGNGNQIRIETRELTLASGGLIGASTYGVGNSGSIWIQAQNRIAIDGAAPTDIVTGILSTTEQGGIGNSGDITLEVGSLFITNGGAINAGTFGTGNSGDVLVRARDRVVFDGGSERGFSSGIATAVDFTGMGDGGDLTIQARSVSLTNGGLAEATSYGNGNAGSVVVSVLDDLTLAGTYAVNGLSSGLFSATFSNGRGGNVIATAPIIRVLNGAAMDVRTYGAGSGGNLAINADTLDLQTGGQLIAITQGAGQAGNITVNAREQVTIAGNDPTYFNRIAQFASAERDPAVTNQVSQLGGTIDSVSPNSGLFVRSQQTGEAGNITVTSPTLRMSDRATLNAETASGNGGNITLNIPNLLLLRRNSTISATAGTAQSGGNGGNVAINAGFIVAVSSENSDIIANAFTGRGGNVRINAQAIFGTQFRPNLTPASDITASSTFGINGQVDINTLNVDPNRGLVALPTGLVDSSRLMIQSCIPRGQTMASAFIATGRGGVPPSPTEPLQNESVIAEWVGEMGNGSGMGLRRERSAEREWSSGNGVQSPIEPNSPKLNVSLAEAQGWLQDAQGTVFLVSSAPNVQPQTSAIAPALCR